MFKYLLSYLFISLLMASEYQAAEPKNREHLALALLSETMPNSTLSEAYAVQSVLVKQKMVNETIDMSYYILSKYTLIQWIFKNLLKLTKIQSKRQLKFRQ